MTDAQIIKAAVARYGKRNPSPDDIVSRACPRYHVSQADTARYHRLANEIIRQGEALPRTRPKRCRGVGCSNQLKASQKLYCSVRCRSSRAFEGVNKRKPLPPRRCKACGKYMTPRPDEHMAKWLERKYCDRECVNKDREIRLVPHNCKNCGKPLVRKTYRDGRPEAPVSFNRRRYCGHGCANQRHRAP